MVIDMLERIKKDPILLNILGILDNVHLISDGKWDWEHGRKHAFRVSYYTGKILSDLGETAETIELGKIAGLLHDIGLITGIKKGHAKESEKYAKIFLDNYNINIQDKEIILNAIRNHSIGTNITSNVGLALLLADKIDLASHRVENSTIQDEVNEEFMKVMNVEISITNQNIYINYKAKESFNISILNSWDKAIIIPFKVAKYLGKKCMFFLNEQYLEVKECYDGYQFT